TRHARGCAWPTTARESFASVRFATSIPPKPIASSHWPSRLSTCAGMPMSKWRVREPRDSRQFPTGSSLHRTTVASDDGFGHPLHGPRIAKPAGRLALPPLLHARRDPPSGRLRRRRGRHVLALRGGVARASGERGEAGRGSGGELS